MWIHCIRSICLECQNKYFLTWTSCLAINTFKVYGPHYIQSKHALNIRTNIFSYGPHACLMRHSTHMNLAEFSPYPWIVRTNFSSYEPRSQLIRDSRHCIWSIYIGRKNKCFFIWTSRLVNKTLKT